MNIRAISKCLPSFSQALVEEIKKFGISKDIRKNQFIIKQGQFIHHLPIIVEGTAKVYCQEDELQLFLYYVYPGNTCVCSFAHILENIPIDFSAVATTDTSVLLIPIDKVKEWLSSYPPFTMMILQAYQKHYQDLLTTTKQLICYNLEERVLIFLREKSVMDQSKVLEISHRNIANALATSREVISRLMIKLKKAEKIEQIGRKIKLLE